RRLVPRISGTGSSSWPTPRVMEELPRRARSFWPTPTVGDSKSARNATAKRNKIPPTGIHKGYTLTDAVTQWPTPTANRWSGLQSHGQNAILGKLNPMWVEWLMGYSLGWTDLEDSGIVSCPK
ncbi:MAG: hypothetical protein Q7O66_16535, partial [Dehalococcoidia bacterium]|nr:hypothetical protein [Dehalococcoidia bacterium]